MGTVHAGIRGQRDSARGRMKALGVSATNCSDNYDRMTMDMDMVVALVEMGRARLPRSVRRFASRATEYNRRER